MAGTPSPGKGECAEVTVSSTITTFRMVPLFCQLGDTDTCPVNRNDFMSRWRTLNRTREEVQRHVMG